MCNSYDNCIINISICTLISIMHEHITHIHRYDTNTPPYMLMYFFLRCNTASVMTTLTHNAVQVDGK